MGPSSGGIAIGACLLVLVGTGTGCGVPVPTRGHRVVAGRRIEARDLEFAVRGESRREEFVSRWGEPWAWYEDLRVAAYYWETQEGKYLWRLTSEMEEPGGVVPITRLHYLLVGFDADGRLRGWAFRKKRRECQRPRFRGPLGGGGDAEREAEVGKSARGFPWGVRHGPGVRGIPGPREARDPGTVYQRKKR